MKYINEYRDREAIQKYIKALYDITNKTNKKWNIMEICGGQTHSIVKFGLDQLIPPQINLLHGPGCPVCVTSVRAIDQAVELANRSNVILCSFGDMLRVPGSKNNLLATKAKGGDVRIVYSPLDALEVAVKNPQKEVVFFAVGFETTAPANALAAIQAKVRGLKNFSLLISHVLVPPAIKAIVQASDNCVQGFLAAGHVCTIMGISEYNVIGQQYRVPIVVTGFEPLDIIQGIFLCVKQLENGRYDVENQYSRSVRQEGNLVAKQMLCNVFDIVDQTWRGLGIIPQSGFALKPDFQNYDAIHKFELETISSQEHSDCISGDILKGNKKPYDCACFGKLCNPMSPLGAPMVSSEGACAAYFHYRRQELKEKSNEQQI